MGKRKRSVVARSEAAKKHWKAYWQEKKKKESEGATQSTSQAEAAGEQSVEAGVGATSLTDPPTAAAYRDKLLSGKLSGGEGVSDDNAFVVISISRLKELLSTNRCDICGEQKRGKKE